MKRLTVSLDKNANLKALRKLEADGRIELFAVGIVGIQDTKKIKNKDLPIAVIGSKFSVIDRSSIAALDTKYHLIQEIVGKQNHGDCIHLEKHICSNRDLFVTDDNDLLSCRQALHAAFGVTILTVSELLERFVDPPDR